MVGVRGRRGAGADAAVTTVAGVVVGVVVDVVGGVAAVMATVLIIWESRAL